MDPGDVDDFLAYQTYPEVMRYQPYEAATAEGAAHFLAKQDCALAPCLHGDGGGHPLPRPLTAIGIATTATELQDFFIISE